MKELKILFYDLETSAIVGHSWGIWDQNIIHVVRDWQLLSFAYKFEGDKEVTVLSRRTLTEKQLVKKLHKVLNSADLVVTHNGISFDNKKANAKFVQFGLSPVTPAKQVDTCSLAKRKFNFTSNKLDDLCKLLKVGGKVKTGGYELWERCMKGEIAALKKMEGYNCNDVVILEKLYLKLRPFASNLPNLTLLKGYRGCPSCRSVKCRKKGFQATATSLQQSWLCNDCGHRFLTAKSTKVGK